jgi:signal transduction histidine kinase
MQRRVFRDCAGVNWTVAEVVETEVGSPMARDRRSTPRIAKRVARVLGLLRTRSLNLAYLAFDSSVGHRFVQPIPSAWYSMTNEQLEDLLDSARPRVAEPTRAIGETSVMPRLPDFIRDNTEQILAEWENFARGLATEEKMDIVALRDHAKDMLNTIATDLDAPQSRGQQLQKSHGHSDASPRTTPTAAQAHGAGRAISGFTVEQMVSEFRALRASVLHLWSLRQGRASAEDLQMMTRFNEAVDQAIAESISTYAHEVRQSKDRFLGILAHDLRTPLGAIMTSSRFMLDIGALAEPNLALVTRIEISSRRMNRLVADLLEFTRTRFGDTIPIIRAETNLAAVLRDVAAEVSASYPRAAIHVEPTNDLHGQWDGERLTQALINLVSNAAQHGDPDRPILITTLATPDEIVVSVHNDGPPIAHADLDHLFDPMKRSSDGSRRDRRHLGLGLYIVDKIAAAHGGRVDVESSVELGTTFRLHLPTIARD